MVLIALFAALDVVGAFFKIPFYPVPISLQSFFVVLSGVMLGPVPAFAATTVYMALGLCGLPVFAGGGGLQYIFQPSFGYALGFLAAAPLAGLIAGHARRPSFARCLLGTAAGSLVIYAVGIPYLAFILHFVAHASPAASHILTTGFLVFLPGDALKAIAAAALGNRVAALAVRPAAGYR